MRQGCQVTVLQCASGKNAKTLRSIDFVFASNEFTCGRQLFYFFRIDTGSAGSELLRALLVGKLLSYGQRFIAK